MVGAVGVGVGAEDLVLISTCEPLCDISGVPQQIDTGEIGDDRILVRVNNGVIVLSWGEGDVQRARCRPRDGDEPIPDRGLRQVDGVHGRTPSKQGSSRCHLGSGPHDSEVQVRQVKPIRVVQQQMQAGRKLRLGDAVLDPCVQLAPQVSAEQPLPAVWHRQARLSRRASANSGGAKYLGVLQSSGKGPGLAVARELESAMR